MICDDKRSQDQVDVSLECFFLPVLNDKQCSYFIKAGAIKRCSRPDAGKRLCILILGHEGKKKDRGRLEVKISFTVRSGSLENLSKDEKYKSTTLGSLSHVAQSVGGSLMSLGSAEKRKGIKKFAKSIGSKMHLKSKKKNGISEDEGSSIGSISSLHVRNNLEKFRSRQTLEDADPGVVSDDDDFTVGISSIFVFTASTA